MNNYEEILESIIRRQADKKPQQRARSIGTVFEEYKKKLRKHKKHSGVVELLLNLLPKELVRHCRVVSLLRGVLKIEVEAGPYMFEIQSFRSQLLEQLQLNCPRAKIDSIRLVACEILKKEADQKRVKA